MREEKVRNTVRLEVDMMRRTAWIVRLAVSCLFAVLGSTAVLLAQPSNDPYALPPGHYITGKPWTSIIPDPDRFQWPTQGDRPGYRYRGMLPMQQRFYDYIQDKRKRGVAIREAEEATIRELVMSRRWPETPRPNKFWAAYMRYLRDLDTLDLNIPQGIMLDQLMSRGLVPVDMPPNRSFEKVRDYLNAGPFKPRCFLERVFGRVEPWMDRLYAGYGFDMRPPAAAANTFPNDAFNGMQITYNVSGATLTDPEDVYSFTTGRAFSGVLQTGGTLSVSGRVSVGGYGADLRASVWAGSKKDEKSFYIENSGKGAGADFSVSVPVPPGTKSGGFAIRLNGRYSMGGGGRELYVTADLEQSAAESAAEKAAADAKWRQEVEDTLRRLGYENTPEGKEIAEMREALAGGDAAWNTFVTKRLDQMSGDNSPQIAEYRELENAMAAGGAEWDRYVAKHGKPSSTEDSGNLATASSLVKQGQDFYEKTKYAEAVGAFTKAIEANPKSAEAYAGRGLAKRGLNDNENALADINRALQLDPNSADAYRGRSMVRRAQNDFQGALADANRVVELAPANHRAYLTRGLAREALKDLSGAIGDFNRAIQINPSYAMSYFYRGRARLDTKDNANALADYNHFIESNATDSMAFNNRGLAKERLGDLKGAIADYEKAISLNPNNDTAKRNLVNVRAKLVGTKTEDSGVKKESGTITETITVPATASGTTSSRSVLENGQTYSLQISGVFSYWDSSGRTTGADALYEYRGERPVLFSPWSPLVINGKPLKDWIEASGNKAEFRSDHVYTVVISGHGKPLTLSIFDPGPYSDNSGSLSVKLGMTSGSTPLSTPPPPRVTPKSVEGSWGYQNGGFKDTHIFLPNGKMGNPPPAPEGTWAIEGGKLVIRWLQKNGTWINEYTYIEGAGQLSGYTIDPSGQRSRRTLTRREAGR